METLSPESKALVKQIITFLQEKEGYVKHDLPDIAETTSSAPRSTAAPRQSNLTVFGPITQAEYYTQRLVQAASLGLRNVQAQKRLSR
jgi:hypothetical protein